MATIAAGGSCTDNGRMDVRSTRLKNFVLILEGEYQGNKSALAERLGMESSYLSRFFSPNPEHRRNIGHNFARKIEQRTGKPDGWMDAPHDSPLPSEPVGHVEDSGPDVGLMRRAPLVGTAKLGMDGYYDELEYPAGHGDGHVDVPSRDPHVYTIRVRGSSMEPAIHDGWIVMIEPTQPPMPGEYVLVKLADGRKTVKTFLYDRGDLIGVKSVNTDEIHQLWKDQVEDVQYVGGVFPPSKLRIG